MLLAFYFFFFNDPATTEIYTLSLHDALPICRRTSRVRRGTGRARRSRAAGTSPRRGRGAPTRRGCYPGSWRGRDRKSTRLNSSHVEISYAVFCLKKKKKNKKTL